MKSFEYDSAEEDLDSDSELFDDDNSLNDIARPEVESNVIGDNDDADDAENSNADKADNSNVNDANADDAEIANADNDYDSEPSFDSKLLEDDDASEDDDSEDDGAQEEEEDDEDEDDDDDDDSDDLSIGIEPAMKIIYESLDKDELVKLCRSRGIKQASRRWKDSTLIQKLAVKDLMAEE